MIRSWQLALCYSALLLLISFGLTQCNPVKQVMKDRERVHRVFTQALRSGIESCVTDTVTLHTSDTLVNYDTNWVFSIDTLTGIDTIEKVKTVPQRVYITKTITIKDTVRLKIKDVTTEQILRGDVLALREQLSAETLAKNEAKKSSDKWKLRFFVLLFISAAWFSRKLWLPLLKIKLPI